MYIEEVEDQIEDRSEERRVVVSKERERRRVVVSDAKRVLVGAGARALFYPTLLYNVLRNKIQAEFRWWDRVDQHVLLGAVPFPTDVPLLKELGVAGVVTLNEPYETLVPSSLYQAYNIDHLVIPTRDYMFAPSLADICQAVAFIHENATAGKMVYIHCKAGRGRSTTIVLCYLVEHREMTPESAYEYVRSIRPRVLLASSQWKAVLEYYNIKVKKTVNPSCTVIQKSPSLVAEEDNMAFDDESVVIVTKSDLDGYEAICDSKVSGKATSADLTLASCSKVWFARQAVVARFSRLRLRCNKDSSRNKLQDSANTDQLESMSVDIQVY